MRELEKRRGKVKNNGERLEVLENDGEGWDVMGSCEK